MLKRHITKRCLQLHLAKCCCYFQREPLYKQHLVVVFDMCDFQMSVIINSNLNAMEKKKLYCAEFSIYCHISKFQIDLDLKRNTAGWKDRYISHVVQSFMDMSKFDVEK